MKMLYEIEDYIQFEQWLDERESMARAYRMRVRKRRTSQSSWADRLKALLQARQEVRS